MKKLLFTLLLFSPIFSFSQRSIPYPIILVHGLGGNASTWDTFKGYLNSTGLSIEGTNLSYCLNANGDVSMSRKEEDVYEYPYSVGNKDVYTISFDECAISGIKTSSESAIVKQGYALYFAIRKVLSATGADKVILMGHSMGGLAIREYLQNSNIWQADGRHHVAKLVTVGTPHGGSNLSLGVNIGSLFGIKEYSEAVRDLRSSYLSGYSGVYLFGGRESSAIMNRGLPAYDNYDVNCNGSIGDNIIGLNQKSIPNDLAFSCVIGGPNDSDLVVTTFSQNLNNYYYNIGSENYYYNCNLDINCHRNEPKKAISEMMSALDEPSYQPHQYGIEFNKLYRGLFTIQPNGITVGDVDTYTFYVPQKGKITLSANLHPDANGQVIIQAPNSEILRIYGSSINSSAEAPMAGTYRIIFAGNSGNDWRGYNYSLSFCGYLDTPGITSNNATTFCEGNSTTLSVPSGFEAYQWYKDGVKVGSNSTQLQVSQVGTYTLDAYKCGNANKTSNSVKITVNPNPVKPDLQTEEKPLLFMLKTGSTESINWLLNGTPISKATSSNYVPQKGGNYSVLASRGNCISQSDVITIPDAPTLTTLTSTVFCDGDSVKINTNLNLNTYRWYRDSTKIDNIKSELVAKQSGAYRAVYQSGKGLSIPSDPITVNIKPNPTKPDLQTEEKPLLFTLKTGSTESINWLLNGTPISKATSSIYVPQKGGNYSILASRGNCVSQSDVITIPDAPSLIALTNTIFCEGDSVRIRANISVDNYRWYRDSTKLANIKSELVVKQSGTYRAVLQSGKGLSIPSIAVAVKTKPSPIKPLVTNDIKPEQFTLTSNSAVNNQWYFNNIAINLANQQSYVPEQVGNYFVRVTSDDCFSNSDNVRIFIDKPVIELTSKNPACDSLLLRSPKGFGAYRWNIGGQILNTLSNEIIIKKSGNISLNVGRGKISSPQSDVIGIVINPTPAKPIITLTDDLEIPKLKSSCLFGNQWYFSGNIINDATDQFLKNLAYGEYTVQTTQLGCVNSSEIFKISLIDDFAFSEKIKVYPNPNSGVFKVEVPFSNITSFSIYAMNGIEVLTDSVTGFNRGKDMNVSIPSGIYILRIRADGREVIRKISINR